jgi:tetratricopeptide (TPR) repeat protein
MMPAKLRVPLDAILIFCMALLGAAVYRTNSALDVYALEQKAAGDVGALPDGATVRVLSLGFDRFIADLFWLRTIYYVGDEHSMQAGYPAVDRLANLVTDIDPEFRIAYVVMSGAIGGLKGDPDAAIALLEKGVKHVDHWKLHFLLGFNYFMERLDYASAARELKRAAEVGRDDGAPPYLAFLAARLYANAGDPETALTFIRARLQEEQEPTTRAALEKRFADLWIHRDLERIDAAATAYRERTGAAPDTVQVLVSAGLLEREPRDPKGGAYRIESGWAACDLPHERLKVNLPYRPTRRDIQQQYEQLQQQQEGGNR